MQISTNNRLLKSAAHILTFASVILLLSTIWWLNSSEVANVSLGKKISLCFISGKYVVVGIYLLSNNIKKAFSSLLFFATFEIIQIVILFLKPPAKDLAWIYMISGIGQFVTLALFSISILHKPLSVYKTAMAVIVVTGLTILFRLYLSLPHATNIFEIISMIFNQITPVAFILLASAYLAKGGVAEPLPRHEPDTNL